MGPYQPMYLKSKNRKLVFDLFKQYKELSRAQIAKLTEMSFPTAMKVVDFLIQKNVILELGEFNTEMSGPGRRSKLLQFNPDAYHAIGVEVEGSRVIIGLINLQGEILSHETVHIITHDNLDYFSEVIRVVKVQIKQSKAPVLGVGIGFPGNINPETNEIVSYNPLRITKPTSLTELLPKIHETLELPIFIDNDVNLACAGEHLVTDKSTQSSLVYLSLGTGFGSGIITKGKLWRGERFSAGEIGNLLMTPIDNSKQGIPGISSLEKSINLQALKNRFGIDFEKNEYIDSSQKEKVVSYLAPYLSTVIFNLLTVLDIRHYSISGIIPQKLNPLLNMKISEILSTIPEEIGTVTISVPQSKFPVLSGAASMVFDQLIFEEFSM